jgi:uncharacterized LabA/DUF88 family protein
MTSSGNSNEKIAILIDGWNTSAAVKTAEVNIDYRKFLEFFGRIGRVMRANYYSAIPDDVDDAPIYKLLDFLEYNGFVVVTKPLKTFKDQQGRKRSKGSMDVEIAVDAMQMSDKIDHIVLMSGNGEFRHLIECLQRKGLKVTVVSTMRGASPIVADEIRRQADWFIDIADIKDSVSRS